MKNAMILVGMLAIGAVGGACHKDTQKITTPVTTVEKTDKPAATKTEQKAPDVTGNQKVSPGLAVSADIAAACGLKVPEGTNPTFDYDKDDLSPDDRKVLDQIATCLMTGALKGKAVALTGRADPRGTEEYNMGLGSRRAETVNAYLTRSGVAAAQLGVTTRGSIDAEGTDEAGWAKDRRVDITLKTDVEAKS